MKVYLDDQRGAPEGWKLVRSAKEAIGYLKSGKVTEISLDHDLGDDDSGTGYDVIKWIEQAVVEDRIYSTKNPHSHFKCFSQNQDAVRSK